MVAPIGMYSTVTVLIPMSTLGAESSVAKWATTSPIYPPTIQRRRHGRMPQGYNHDPP
jgi:hypothetical protein